MAEANKGHILGGTAIKPKERHGWERIRYIFYNPETGQILSRFEISLYIFDTDKVHRLRIPEPSNRINTRFLWIIDSILILGLGRLKKFNGY